ncbi:hypothetical protein Veis_3717 [Verminephrobacter eiseniae EF01-2]|uniref:Uncharacterized protein n=1 Tax=Verminephrobacter eiseniae (strain EF01-2) TaxID=391735 RepID=A1WP75_VEREI|nr:hypothetical protein Veis_3717 [Verminephrobacter eiseniae EF01-2]
MMGVVGGGVMGVSAGHPPGGINFPSGQYCGHPFGPMIEPSEHTRGCSGQVLPFFTEPSGQYSIGLINGGVGAGVGCEGEGEGGHACEKGIREPSQHVCRQ